MGIFYFAWRASKEEVEELGIHVGCVVTYEDEFMILNDKYYVGRALDNRIGGFMIAVKTINSPSFRNSSQIWLEIWR